MQTNNRVNEPDYQKVIKEPRQCRQCFFFLIKTVRGYMKLLPHPISL